MARRHSSRVHPGDLEEGGGTGGPRRKGRILKTTSGSNLTHQVCAAWFFISLQLAATSSIVTSVCTTVTSIQVCVCGTPTGVSIASQWRTVALGSVLYWLCFLKEDAAPFLWYEIKLNKYDGHSGHYSLVLSTQPLTSITHRQTRYTYTHTQKS